MIKNKKGAIAIGQVLILLIAIFAFAFMIDSVNADNTIITAVEKIATPTFPPAPKLVFPEVDTGLTIQTGSAGAEGAADVVAGAAEPFKYTLLEAATWTFIAALVGAVIGATMGAILGRAGASRDYALIGAGTAAAGAAGYFAGTYGATAIANLGLGTGIAGTVMGAIGTALPFIGIGIAAFYAFKSISAALVKQDVREAIFMCEPWQADRGGENCEVCNDQDFPCTLYECRSLGAGCDLINEDTDEAACIWTSSRDIVPPEISAWDGLVDDNYHYVPIQGVRGVEIKYNNEACLPAFTPFSFGIQLDKRGYCKMADVRTPSFADMQMSFGGNSLAILTQDQWMSFPGVSNLEAEGIEVYNGGNFEYYVRCENVNGNSNREEFLFKFCIDDGPDTTDPIIRRFIPTDNTPIRFFKENEAHELNIEVHVNEPAQCKWGHEDKNYEDLDYNLTCSSSVLNFNAELNYPCTGTLTGLENRQENKFYFRCEDLAGNTNRQSEVLTLRGTEELVISTASPNNTLIKGSTDSIKVTLEATTYAGANSGEASCSYSRTGTYNDYAPFYTTGTHAHSTDVYLGDGSYTYYLQCFDQGGNVAQAEISFDVEKDTAGVTVVRAFKEGNSLKIITDEEATCVYDTVSCLYNFDDGIAMSSYDELNHFTDWDSDSTLYIKCEDSFGNRPAADRCSIQAKAFEL